MVYFIELWSPTPAWLALSTEERANYMAQIGPHVQNLIDQGVQILTWSPNDAKTDKRIDFDYFAIWAFPNQAIADGFQQLVTGAGWYNYFEQVNAMGQAASADSVIGQLIQL
ncbi:MAG: DUF6616 family protein [Saprospiraceae bacterium]